MTTDRTTFSTIGDFRQPEVHAVLLRATSSALMGAR
jgi:hypothetical protein